MEEEGWCDVSSEDWYAIPTPTCGSMETNPATLSFFDLSNLPTTTPHRIILYTNFTLTVDDHNRLLPHTTFDSFRRCAPLTFAAFGSVHPPPGFFWVACHKLPHEPSSSPPRPFPPVYRMSLSSFLEIHTFEECAGVSTNVRYSANTHSLLVLSRFFPLEQTWPANVAIPDAAQVEWLVPQNTSLPNNHRPSQSCPSGTVGNTPNRKPDGH